MTSAADRMEYLYRTISRSDVAYANDLANTSIDPNSETSFLFDHLMSPSKAMLIARECEG
jgi:hypothetical protein